MIEPYVIDIWCKEGSKKEIRKNAENGEFKIRYQEAFIFSGYKVIII